MLERSHSVVQSVTRGLSIVVKWSLISSLQLSIWCKIMLKMSARSGFSRFPDPVDPENWIRPSGTNGEAKTFYLRYYMIKSVPDPVFPIFQIRLIRKTGSGHQIQTVRPGPLIWGTTCQKVPKTVFSISRFQIRFFRICFHRARTRRPRATRRHPKRPDWTAVFQTATSS